MAGDYPSTDFAISEDAAVRRIAHLPSGITIVTPRVEGDPAGVSRVFNVQAGGTSDAHPDEVAQAALRHLRVWLLRRYGIRGRRLRRTVSRSRRPTPPPSVLRRLMVRGRYPPLRFVVAHLVEAWRVAGDASPGGDAPRAQ
jgi:hypothetical protein